MKEDFDLAEGLKPKTAPARSGATVTEGSDEPRHTMQCETQKVRYQV